MNLIHVAMWVKRELAKRGHNIRRMGFYLTLKIPKKQNSAHNDKVCITIFPSEIRCTVENYVQELLYRKDITVPLADPDLINTLDRVLTQLRLDIPRRRLARQRRETSLVTY